MPDLLVYLARHTVREAARGALPGQPLESLLRGEAGFGFVRVLVAQFAQAEAAALGDLLRAGDGVRVGHEQARHLLGRLQVAFWRARAAETGIVDGAAFADAGDHVVQDPPARVVVEHVVGGHRRHPRVLRRLGERVQAGGIARTAVQGEGEVGVPAESAFQVLQVFLQGGIRMVGQQHGDQAFGMGGHVAPLQVAGALAGAALADAEQPAQARVGGAAGGVDQQRSAASEVEPAADDQAQLRLDGALVGARDAGEAVAVGDGERVVAEQLGLGEQLLDVRGAAEEGVVRGDLEFYVGHSAGAWVEARQAVLF